jgi:ferredoxin
VETLLHNNLEHPRWDEVAQRCLNCGNCTLVCPTCFCTTVEDTTDLAGQTAERWRQWDSCFTLDFSYIHGGSIRRDSLVQRNFQSRAIFVYRAERCSAVWAHTRLGPSVELPGEDSMFMERKLSRSLVVVATLALYACLTQVAAAKGGHGGGGHHGGGHHAGGHHGGHNHHAYHPSHHHASHHSHHHSGHHDHHGHHHDGHHHYAHHHHSWHHGGWGPGFWGGAALGYGLSWGDWGGYGDGGGDTYVDNSTNVTPVSNDSGADDGSDDSADDGSSDDQNTAGAPAGDEGFATDDWPELGVVTYAGQYGGSQGQVVVRVVPGSAADEAGAVPGDVILTFNGKPVPSADDLDAAMDGAAGKFELQVWDARTGRKSVLDGALDPAAKAPPASETAASPPVQQ